MVCIIAYDMKDFVINILCSFNLSVLISCFADNPLLHHVQFNNSSSANLLFSLIQIPMPTCPGMVLSISLPSEQSSKFWVFMTVALRGRTLVACVDLWVTLKWFLLRSQLFGTQYFFFLSRGQRPLGDTKVWQWHWIGDVCVCCWLFYLILSSHPLRGWVGTLQGRGFPRWVLQQPSH